MFFTRCGAISGLSIVVSIAVSCGGRSEIPERVHGKPVNSSCPEPDTAEPALPSLMLGQYSYSTFNLTLHNQCTETIWPAWGPVGGFDATVPDPSLWLALWPGESRTVLINYGALEIGLFGRTRCSFDEQGKGACETGDCGGFICHTEVNDLPKDATIYDFQAGFRGGYNVPMRVTTPGCEAHQCSFDLDTCADASRVVGACGVAACVSVCPSASECCHTYSNGCFLGNDVDVTFCR